MMSSIRGFRVIDHNVGTYEQTKKGLSYFYLKRIVQEDEIHTRPLTNFFPQHSSQVISSTSLADKLFPWRINFCDGG